MDIQSRKIAFIQEFLKLQSEEAISRLESLLKKEKQATLEREVKPFTEEELNERIARSEDDFKNGRYKTSKELLSKYK